MQIKISKFEKAWKNYIKSRNEIKSMMSVTSNVMGDYAELLVRELHHAKKMPNSNKDFDLISGKTKIQVKARQIKKCRTSKSLSIFHSWDFDLLSVVLFNEDGSLYKVVEMKTNDAKKFSEPNERRGGDIIRTTNKFLNSPKLIDRTEEVKQIIKENTFSTDKDS